MGERERERERVRERERRRERVRERERERVRERGRRGRGRESIVLYYYIILGTYVDAQKYDSYMPTVRIAIQYMSILLYQK